jgi:AAA15 family ATPase/GTPase
MAAVYGANGAGKSNLLKGINFLKAIATNKNFLNGDSVGSLPSSIVIWFDKVVLFKLGNISNWTSSLNERKFFSITRSIIFLSTIVR